MEHRADAAHALDLLFLVVPSIRRAANALPDQRERRRRATPIEGITRLRKAFHIEKALAESFRIIVEDSAHEIGFARLLVHVIWRALRIVCGLSDRSSTHDVVTAIIPERENRASLCLQRVNRARASAVAAGI